TAFILSGSLSLICSASLCFSAAFVAVTASGTSNRAAKSVRSIAIRPRLLDFGLGILDVLLRNRVVFLLFHFVGLRARVLPRYLVVTGACTGDQLDFEADGFSH